MKGKLLTAAALSLIPGGSIFIPRLLVSRTKNTRSGSRAFVDEVFNTQKLLAPGSIVACDLAGNWDHTGIYVGRNRIVERNGDGTVKKVSVSDFMDSSVIRTGISLFIACSKGKPISSPDIARRARAIAGHEPGYCLITNNCHKLTAFCATGVRHDITSFDSLCSVLHKRFGPIEWRSVKRN
ncbi:lecithin retinol acyltransferase family protein [Pseudomonas sp. S2_H10]